MWHWMTVLAGWQRQGVERNPESNGESPAPSSGMLPRLTQWAMLMKADFVDGPQKKTGAAGHARERRD
jgi:hypothetical protein